MIDRMENVMVDEEQIAPFMETVNKKLEWLSKEQIIKHFVSLEFNRFLDYYKNAPDLNDKMVDSFSPARGKREGSPRREREREKRSDRPFGNSGYSRFFINLGKKDGMVPRNIIGMINDNTRDRDINIGAIDIKDSFSFFEVGEKFTGTIVNAFQNNKYKGRRIRVEMVGDAPEKENKGKRKKNR